MNGTQTGKGRTPFAQNTLELYNEVQLCRELHWSEQDLHNASEDFVWAAMNILALEAEKHERENRHHPPPPR